MDAAVAIQKENERQLQKEDERQLQREDERQLQREDERQTTDHREENEWTKELEAENNVLRREIAEYKEKIINDTAVMKDLERQVCFNLFTQEQTVYRISPLISRNRSTLCYCAAQDSSFTVAGQKTRPICLSVCVSFSTIICGVNSLPTGTTAATPSLMPFGK